MTSTVRPLKIITVSAARLGDTLFCTPAYRWIKDILQAEQLDVISASALSTDTLVCHPSIDHIYTQPDANTLQAMHGQYDLAIHLHHSDAALDYYQQLDVPVLDLTRNYTKQRTHYAEHLLRQLARVFGYDWNAVDNHYVIVPQDKHVEEARALLAHIPAGRTPLIGLHLGCHHVAKRGWRFWEKTQHKRMWPVENFIALGQLIAQRYPDHHFILTGSDTERFLGEQFATACPNTLNIMGNTSVGGLYALLSKINTYICSDTGALHVACATQTPLVALNLDEYVASNTAYPPAAHRHVICRKKITDIQPKDVLSDLETLLPHF